MRQIGRFHWLYFDIENQTLFYSRNHKFQMECLRIHNVYQTEYHQQQVPLAADLWMEDRARFLITLNI